MKNKLIVIAFLLFSNSVFSQKTAYVIYNSKGKKVSYKKMVKKLVEKDVVFFGEIHDNPIAHWLQYEVTLDFSNSRQIILGAEMFEADNQIFLSDYVKKTSTYEDLDSLARLWPNYKTDYAPIVNFAREKQLQFVATNIPRRYANLVYKKGFEALDSLSSEEKEWMAPLPIPFNSELPSYKNILEMMGDHGSPELVKAQAIKDATMAYFILKNYKKNHLFVHYNGAYHSDNYEGILWYLKRERNDLNCGTISTVSQKNVNKLLKENYNIADFIICVDENMTKTY